MSIYKGTQLLAGTTGLDNVTANSVRCLTTAERNALASPQNCDIIYNTDDEVLQIYNGTEWETVSGGTGDGGGAGITISSVTFTDMNFMELGVTHGTPGAVNYIEILGTGFNDFTLGGDTNTVQVQLEDNTGSFNDITYTRHGSTRLTATIPDTLAVDGHETLRVVNGLGQEAEHEIAFQAGPSFFLRSGHVLTAAPGEAISYVVEANTAAAELPITLTAAPSIMGTDLGLTVAVDEDADTWTVSGTLDAAAVAGSSVYTFTATDSDSDSTTFDVTVTVGSNVFGTDLGTSLQFSDRSHTGLWYQPSEGGTTNRNTNTFSIWFQRLGRNSRGGTNFQTLFQQFEVTNVAYNAALYIDTSDRLVWAGADSVSLWNRTTSKRLRDFGSWYHVVLQQNGNGNLTMWINGEEITDFDTNTTNTANTSGAFFTTNIPMVLGSAVSRPSSASSYISANTGSQNYKFVGNIGQFIGCSGLAHNADAFGEFSDEGYWQPIDVSGNTSFVGNDGFILNFDDPANPFNDSSVNNNHWARAANGTDTNSLSASDLSRTSYSSNYAVLDLRDAGTTTSVQDDSREVRAAGTVPSSIAFSTGKYYVEAVIGNGDDLFTYLGWGEGRSQAFTESQSSNDSYSAAMYVGPGTGISGALYSDGRSANKLSGQDWSQTAPGGTMSGISEFTAGDIIGMAIDADNDTVQFFNFDGGGTTITRSSSLREMTAASPTAPLWRKPWNIIWNSGGSSAQNSGVINFGQYDGTNYDTRLAAVNAATSQTFTSLNTNTLTDPTVVPSEHFNTGRYTGVNAGYTNSSLDFQPDLVLIKNNTGGTVPFNWFDSIRGGGQAFQSNSTSGNVSFGSSGLTFNSNGFSIGGESTNINNGAHNYSYYAWKAGGTAVANSDGTQTTMVSANPEAGFSIVEGSAALNTASNTFGHGLNQAPEIIIRKANANENWNSYIAAGGTNNNIVVNLNSAASGNFWVVGNSTFHSPTNLSAQTDWIAYCWHSVPGYSAIGSYSGLGNSDGPYIYTGFKPAFVLMKSLSGGTGSWEVIDNASEPNNPLDTFLRFDQTQVRTTATFADFYSNGFKVLDTTSRINVGGRTYLYMAFAESPFKYSLGR